MIEFEKLSLKGKNIVLEEQENGCIKCLSHCRDSDGYVRIRYNGKHDRLFRVLYQQKYRTIPKGMVLRHLCNNTWCVNINHLKIGTQKDNSQDMVNSGRSTKGRSNKKLYGENNGCSKLTEKQVKEIYLSKLSYKKLSEIYKVSTTNIFYIKKKKQWKWLTDKFD